MKGFTLLETTVAITILITGILGPLSMATYTLSSASRSENEIIAYNLALEALEFVIYTRDTNIFADNSWLNGLDDSGNQCDQSDGCNIDVTNTSDPIKQCNGGAGCSNADIVYRNATSGLYNHDSSAGNSATIFKRRVYMDNNNLDNSDERRIRVTVTWSEKTIVNKSITIEHHIFERE